MYIAIITTAILAFYLIYAVTSEDMTLQYPGDRMLIAVYVLAALGYGWTIMLEGPKTLALCFVTVLLACFPVWMLTVSALKRERPRAEVWFIMVLSLTMLWQTWR